MKKFFFFLYIFIFSQTLWTQTNILKSKFTFTGDFRFRVEEDWDSRKSDGSYRDDRSRLRYRVRIGGYYDVNDWASMGVRIRTSQHNKQQDPHLTLGDGFKEFSAVPIGFEKLFFQTKYQGFFFWVGKNTFPFEKSNELFWCDNVYPEGVFLKNNFPFESPVLNNLELSVGHFIIGTAGKSFKKDSYFEGFQMLVNLFNSKLKLFPSFYSFKNIPNIPDGSGTFIFNYSILHLGTRVKLLDKPLINFETDYYVNIEDYNSNDNIQQDFKNQKNGFVTSISYGHLKNSGDWLIQLTYTYLEQYAAVDFLAQNDWARWDYLSSNSPDSRLTNFKGLEFVGGYAINKSMTLRMKYYLVDQLVPYGKYKETGSRIRLDLDVKL